MADLKISQLNSLAGPSLDSTDLLAVVDVSASETKKITSVELVRYGYGFIPSASLDGDIIEAATTAARGTVQLTDSTGSTSTTTAATPNAVKTAYDLANAALPKTGGTMTGQILGDDSTSPTSPGFAFDGDADTGMVRLGVNELGLTTGGVVRITLDASGNVVIPGNFTVQGTTTTIDTTTLVVKDKNIEMGAVGTPTDITADGGGITLKGTTDKTINWIDATDAWTLSEHVNIASGKEYRINGVKVLDATSLGSGVTGSSLTSVGTIGTGTWQGTAVGTAYGGTGIAGGFANGELLIGKTDGTLAKTTLTASTGVTITNGNGSITISATGSGGTITGVTATSPLASSGGTAPDISIQDGTTSQKGAVQLEDSTSSTSTTKAATPASVKSAYDLANAALPKAGGTMTGTITFAAGQTISGYLATGDIGVTVQGYDADTAKTDVAQSFTAAQRGSITALTDGATITPDFALANNYSVTLGGNRTLANPTNLTAGQSGCIWITQDGTGSRTLAYGSQWDFTGGTAPTLTTAASSVDCLVYAVQSSTRITATLVTNLS
jgi:hypothetical protein